MNWLNEKPFTTLFVDGNHENMDRLNSYPVEEWNGGKVHKIRPSVIHLMRGQVFNINGKKIFTFGGASSHDKDSRKEGKSWLSRELPSENEINVAIKNLTEANWKVDIVITHCAPSTIQRLINPSYDENILTDFLDNVKEKLIFEKWYFGHYHIDKQIDKKLFAVFNSISKP